MIAPFFIDQAFTTQECAQIILLAKQAGLQPAGLVGGQHHDTIRTAQIAWLDDEGNAAWVMQRIVTLIQKANRGFFDFLLESFDEKLQVAEYTDVNEGHFDWHSDYGSGDLAKRRKLTLVVQLSSPDDYKGGLLNINPNGSIIKAPLSQGSAILFPSFMLHAVEKVTQGTRYSLTIWVHGPSFR